MSLDTTAARSNVDILSQLHSGYYPDETDDLTKLDEMQVGLVDLRSFTHPKVNTTSTKWQEIETSISKRFHGVMHGAFYIKKHLDYQKMFYSRFQPSHDFIFTGVLFKKTEYSSASSDVVSLFVSNELTSPIANTVAEDTPRSHHLLSLLGAFDDDPFYGQIIQHVEENRRQLNTENSSED
jgi:hypothetical protein